MRKSRSVCEKRGRERGDAKDAVSEKRTDELLKKSTSVCTVWEFSPAGGKRNIKRYCQRPTDSGLIAFSHAVRQT